GEGVGQRGYAHGGEDVHGVGEWRSRGSLSGGECRGRARDEDGEENAVHCARMREVRFGDAANVSHGWFDSPGCCPWRCNDGTRITARILRKGLDCSVPAERS